MFTIDLEKELVSTKSKNSMTTPKELLLIKEYDKFTELADDDVLTRVGLNKALKHGKSLKEKITPKAKQAESFGKDKVFHISQIENIANKYRLRFLPTTYYNGIVDEKLPYKISTFEMAFNLRCNETNTMILAPKESFTLQEKPKDPLLFYKINDEYFYLIHKWGNDLSVFRGILALFSNPLICFLHYLIVLLLASDFIFNYIDKELSYVVFTGGISLLLYRSFMSLIGIFRFPTILSENEWDSLYR